jgi:polysaccharide export outer membrane protein
MNMRRKIWFVFFLCTGLMYGQTQEKQGSIWDQATSKAPASDQKGKEGAAESVVSIPMEGPVDPRQYIVGPFDLFTLAFWGSPPLQYTMPVTPEGSLLIPTVGEIHVADLTLAAAKNRVEQAVAQKYHPGSFTMTLIRPRSLIVTLRGSVPRPGKYIASSVDRVEKVLLEGASEVQTPSLTYAIPALTPSGLPVFQQDFRVPKISSKPILDDQVSTRNIRLIRRGGDTLRVDIPKYYATLDSKYNPFLTDGDLIIVPNKTRSSGFVSVLGGVNAPGDYEYAEGDSVLGLIRIAEGLLETADRRSAMLYREMDNDSTQEIAIDLAGILSGKISDVPLRRGDRVLVRNREVRRKDAQVTVGGEVAFPGVYPISLGTTKLSHIIRLAGGLTTQALPGASVLWRKDEKYSIPDAAQLEYLTYLRSHQFSMVDSMYYFLNLKLGRQPVVVHFKELLAKNDSSFDVLLSANDYLYIASNSRSVVVQGQVGDPGYVPFVPGADYRYYIRKAGDFQELADEGEVRIIKGGAMSWFEPGDTTIEPGDHIWVPKQSKKSFQTYFAVVRDIGSFAIAVATLIFAVRATR